MENRLIPYEAVNKIQGRRVIVLAPHPDDEVFGCGGAIMRHVADGDSLQVVILSDGAFRADTKEQWAYSQLRRAESTQAAKILGYGVPEFWGLPDRGIEYGEFLVRRIEHAIETFQADLIYAPSVYEMHPDHRALGMAAVEAVRRNGTKVMLAMYEVGVPMLRPDLLLDISDICKRKQQAMACFVSQLKEQSYDQHIAALNKFRTYTLGSRVTAAEAYVLTHTDELKTGVLKVYESEYQRQRDIGLPMTPDDVPLVSVLIRSMDRSTLQNALNSVALQTYSHLEVVVVNAKGGEHRPLENWCGRFLLRLVNTSQVFQRSRAANAALKEAKGQYLIFLDDDDWFAPHHISALVERIRKEPDVDAVYANIQVIGAVGQFEDHIFREEFDPIRMMADNLIPIHSVLFDQCLIGKGCLFDETLSVYEDWDFWLQVSRHTAFAHVDEVGAYYCASGNSEVGLQGMDESRKRARELIFEKWKSIWSGAEINLLLAHKDSMLIAKSHELDSTVHALNAQLNSTVQALQAQSESTFKVLQAQSESTIKALRAQSDSTIQAVQAQSNSTVQTLQALYALRAHEAQLDTTILELEDKLNSTVQSFEARIKHQDEALSGQICVIRSLNSSLLGSEVRSSKLEDHINEVLASTSWRLTYPLRWAATRARNARYVFTLSHQFSRENGGGFKGATRLALKTISILNSHGPFGLTYKIRDYANRKGNSHESHQDSQTKEQNTFVLNSDSSSQVSNNAPTIAPLKQKSVYIARSLFHRLPVSKKVKYRLQNFCYRSFPSLFQGLPSYKFWLARGAACPPHDDRKSELATKYIDWSMMLPSVSKKTADDTVPHGEIDIVIPVYRGLKQTQRCIDSVLKSTVAVPFRLVVINDASPEIEITEYLQSLHAIPRLILIENPLNLGFTATVNKGMNLSSINDVVLLNSDTEVANDWLDRLRMHAYSAARISSVTPFSGNATICNYPTLEGMKELPDQETTQTLDAAFCSANSGRNIEIPTAVGFCMYIRRDCLTEVGLFDVDTFKKGYGEENDFCLRASAMGWKHLLAADTFVFHEGEVSFQAASNPGKERAMQILRDRYPYYETVVAEHVTLNEAYPLRVAATAARFKNSSLPVVLHVLHSHGGGTEKHVEELCHSYLGRAKLLIMNAPPVSADNSKLRIRSATPFDGFDLSLPASNIQFLVLLCQSFGVSLIHIHHVLDYPFDLKILIKSLAVPFYLTVHDYYLICPRINLMPLEQNYCGEPVSRKCNQCLSPDAPHGGVDIIWWRANNAWLFEDASVVICPSDDVAMRCKRYFPKASYKVVRHEKTSAHNFNIVKAPPLNKDEPLRVAILGVLARHKGLALISEALVIADRVGSPLEFRLIGFAEDVIQNVPSSLFIETGHYADTELPKLIEDFNPHLILFPACWPETYSYTLTVALNSCRPIMATNIGAFPERVSSRPWTWLINWNTSSSELLDKLEEIRRSNFQTRMPPSLLEAFLVPCPLVIEDGNFYQNEYLPHRSKFRNSLKIVDIRKTGRITAMVLCENVGTQPSPCAYIRLILPLSREHSHGLDTRWVTDKDFSFYKSDILIIQRTAITSISIINKIISHCRENHIRIVYDLDDFLLALPDDHPEYAVYEPKSAAVLRWLIEADEVWVSTEALRLGVAKFNPRVCVVPNYLDELLWVKPLVEEVQTDLGGVVRLLYMGTQTHLADFELIKNVLHRIKKEFSTAVEIYLIGVTANGSSDKWYKTLMPPQTVGSNYPAFVNWIVNGQEFDIGITPLVDNEFNRCKSAIKFLDYSAMGMVTVASDIGVYTTIRNEENGFLAENSDDSWYRILKNLISDPCLRRHVKHAAEGEVFKSYGYASVGGIRTKLLATLLSESRRNLHIKPEVADHSQLANLI